MEYIKNNSEFENSDSLNQENNNSTDNSTDSDEQNNTPDLKPNDPPGFQNRINSLYGKLKGTERERDRYQKRLEELESKINSFESKQTEKEIESRKQSLRSEYEKAIEEGDEKKASSLIFDYQDLISSTKGANSQNINQENNQINQDQNIHQVKTGNQAQERFFSKYEHMSNDQQFISLATQIDQKLKVDYQEEINSGRMTEDTFFYLLDREIESTIKSGAQNLKTFSGVTGITTNQMNKSNNEQINLSPAQKKIAMRWVLDGTCKTQEDAYKKYASSLNSINN